MKKRILSLSLFILLILTFSTLMFSCGGDLSAPSDIKYDGNIITWSGVDGAEKYHVQIDSMAEISTLGTAYSYPSTGNQFTVKVTAVCEGKKSNSVTHTFIPLGQVTEINVADDGSISWEPVANASGYILNIDGNESTVYTTEYSELEAGAHSVSVKATSTAVAEGTTYYAKWSPKKDLTICADVNAETIAYDPTNLQLVWGAVPGAYGYKLTLTGVGFEKNEEVTKPYYDFDAEMRDFTVSIRTIGNHTSTFDAQGEATKTLRYLEPVTNLRVVDGELLWDGSEGADAYRLKVNGKMQAQLLSECKAGGFPVNQSVTVSVLPTSKDTVYFSSWSVDLSFTILPSPTLKWNNLALDGDANNNVYWDSVNGASGYQVKVLFDGNEIDTAALSGNTHAYANAYLQSGEYTVSVKSVAPVGTDLCDSAYSAPIKILRLSAPKYASGDPITSVPDDITKGFTVTFTPVSGAVQYRIWKDGAQYATVSGDRTQYTDTNVIAPEVITAQQFNYKIQCIGRDARTEAGGGLSVVLDSLYSASLSFNIDVLPAPTNPIMDGFRIKYDTITGAFGYVVNTGTETYKSDTGYYDLSILKAGVYQVSVSARGNGGSTLSSNYTPAISVTRLAKPTNIRIMTDVGDDGKLTFDEVTNAQSYELVIRGIAEPIKINYRDNIKNYISTDGTYLHLVAVANNYQDGDPATKNYYMTSEDSDTKMFTKLKMPSFGEKPFANGMLNWNPPDNIRTNNFTPTYKVYNAQSILQNVTLNGTSMSLSTLEAGSYSFRVMAIGDGVDYINSDMNTDTPTETVIKLQTPKVTVDKVNNVYTWPAVASAQNYAVYVDGVLAGNDYNKADKVFTFKPSFTDAKEYTVTVTAIGDGGIDYIDSSEAVIKQKTDVLDPPSFTWSYGADYYTENAKLTLTVTEAPELATGFYYTFGGSTYFSEELSFSQSLHSSGSIYCTVYARGSCFDDDEVFWLNSPASDATVHFLDEPGTIDIDSYGTMTWGAPGMASAYNVTVVYEGNTYTKRVSNATCSLLDILGVDLMPTSGSLEISIVAVGSSECVNSKPHKQSWQLD